MSRSRLHPVVRACCLLLLGSVGALAVFSCGSSSSGAPNIPLVELDECPFRVDAGDGVLTTASIRASFGTCAQDHAICPIRAFATCPDGVGTEERLWICECLGQSWQCDIAGRKVWQCPPVDGSSLL